MISDKKLQKIKDIRKLPVVKVTWYDAASHHGWSTLPDARGEDLVECQTVGFLVTRTKRRVNVAQGISDGGKLTEDWAIPTANIKSIKVLR